MQDKAMDTLRDELEEVKGKLHSVQTNLTSCQAEIASDRAEKLSVPSQAAVMAPRQLGRSDSLGPGQLPDVNSVALVYSQPITSYRLVGNCNPHLVYNVEQVVRAGQLHLRRVSRASAFKVFM